MILMVSSCTCQLQWDSPVFIAFMHVWFIGLRGTQDDLLDFLDCSNPGMRSFLKDVEAQTEELKDEWMHMMKDKYGAKVTEDSVQVWRALKSLTRGEARKVIMSVKNEDGFKAWQKLHMHFGPSLSAKQSMALADFKRDGGETRNQARGDEVTHHGARAENEDGRGSDGGVDQRQPRQVGVGGDTRSHDAPALGDAPRRDHGVREAEAGRVGIHQQRRWKRQRHAG